VIGSNYYITLNSEQTMFNRLDEVFLHASIAEIICSNTLRKLTSAMLHTNQW